MIDHSTEDSDRELFTLLMGRVKAIREERQTLESRVKELMAQEMAYARALEAESRRDRIANDSAQPQHRVRRRRVRLTEHEPFGTSTKDFVLGVLSDGQMRSLGVIKQEAERRKFYVPENASLGRVLHGALMGLKVSGQVEMVEKGVWKIAEQNTPSDEPDGVFDL